MHPVLQLHALCASRGDGLLPEFVDLLQRPPEVIEASLDFAALVREHRAQSGETVFPERRPLPTP
jgi:hypothetical protein